MKRAAIIALLFCLAGVAVAQENPENIAFKWGFGAITGPAKKFVSITRDTVLKSGDDIKMIVELTKDCYVYVLHAGPTGEMDLLFPYSVKQFAEDYTTAKNYYIPKGRDWMQFDKTQGKETFYLLASSERLLSLEALLSTYQTSDKAKKPSIAANIQNEIRDLRKKFRTYTTLAEKPVTIGGNIRGVGEAEVAKRPDVSTITTAISASNFYAKTITIDHK